MSRTVERTLSQPSNLPTTSGLRPLLPQQSQNSADLPGISPPGLLTRRASMSAIMPCPKSSLSAVHHNRLDTRLAPALLTPRSCQSVKLTFSFYWNILAHRFIVRVGQIGNSQPIHQRKTQSERYQVTEFGLILSIYLSQYVRRSLGLALCIFQLMLVNGTFKILHLNFNTSLINIIMTDSYSAIEDRIKDAIDALHEGLYTRTGSNSSHLGPTKSASYD